MKKGFTLIELLVAISIIAVLSTIGLSTFSGIQSRARDSVRKNDLNTLATALELYYQTNGEYLENTGSCANGPAPADTLYTDTNFKKFISGNLPKDPKNQNHYCYESGVGLTYKLYAKLEDNTDYILASEDYIAQASTPAPTATPTPTPSPKRVFVTSTKYNGNLGGLSGADQKCQNLATVANLGGTWRAWLSDSTTAARDRLTHAVVPYKLVNSTITIANNWSDLTDGTIQNPISTNESGISSSPWWVWTNSQPDGIISSPSSTGSCNNWTFGAPTGSDPGGYFGLAVVNDFQWTKAGSGFCRDSLNLYCFEQ